MRIKFPGLTGRFFALCHKIVCAEKERKKSGKKQAKLRNKKEG